MEKKQGIEIKVARKWKFVAKEIRRVPKTYQGGRRLYNIVIRISESPII